MKYGDLYYIIYFSKSIMLSKIKINLFLIVEIRFIGNSDFCKKKLGNYE